MKIILRVACLLSVAAAGCNAFLQSAVSPKSVEGSHCLDAPLRQSAPVSKIAKIVDTRTPTALFQSSDTSSAPEGSLDVGALTKWGAALGLQVSLFYGLFSLLDQVVTQYNLSVPFWANCLFFYAVALKSRVLNPLSNQRPNPASLEARGQSKRTMPTWTPPGVVFPIMWLLIIGPIRAYTTALVYDTTHVYAAPAIMAFILHLSIGDVWNTINNVEQRYGSAVVGVIAVWLSKANAAYQYYQVVPVAGEILSITLVWLTVASALITRTWQLNPDPETGEIETLYPVVGKTSTQFAWFNKDDDKIDEE